MGGLANGPRDFSKQSPDIGQASPFLSPLQSQSELQRQERDNTSKAL